MGRLTSTLIANRAILTQATSIYESMYTTDPLANIYTNINTLTPTTLTKENKLQLHTIFNQDREKFEKWKSDLANNTTKESAIKVGKLWLSLETQNNQKIDGTAIDQNQISFAIQPVEETKKDAQGKDQTQTIQKIVTTYNGKYVQREKDGSLCLMEKIQAGYTYQTLDFGNAGKAIPLADATKAFP